MWPGEFAYSLGCTVETWTRRELVLCYDFEQCLQRTRSNFRGEAVEAGLHLTCLRCCFRPPFVKCLPQCGHFESLGLFRGAISISEDQLFLYRTKDSKVHVRVRGQRLEETHTLSKG